MDWSQYWTYLFQASLALLVLALPAGIFVATFGSAVSSAVNRTIRAKKDAEAIATTMTGMRPGTEL